MSDRHHRVTINLPPETPFSPASTYREEELRNDVLSRAIRDAGRWSFGTVYVEVWVLNDSGCFLQRPEGGFWMDEQFHLPHGPEHSCKLCRLVRTTSPGYLPPTSVAPGVGLAGVLWSQVGNQSNNRSSVRSSRLENSVRIRRASQSSRGEMNELGPRTKKIIWREVNALCSDPDTATTERMKLFADCGLGLAAAVPFLIRQQAGIVVYMARAGVDQDRLRSSTNEEYLQAAADLIGSAYCVRGIRQISVEDRFSERDAAFRRVRAKLLALLAFGVSLKHLAEQNPAISAPEQPSNHDLLDYAEEKIHDCAANTVNIMRAKVSQILIKSRGASFSPPPPAPWAQAALSLIGCLLTVAMLSTLNVALRARDSSIGLVMPPFGALMALQYGLTGAPASQPRNIILGQTVSVSIALCINYIPNLEAWHRQTLATGLAVASMQKLGIVHPPADVGAAALAFASSTSWTWSNMAFMLIANTLAIIAAVIVNNYSSIRQYPTF